MAPCSSSSAIHRKSIHSQAEQHVAESKAFITEQQRVIVKSEHRTATIGPRLYAFWKPSFC